MKKTYDYILRVMKATNSEYRLVQVRNGFAEIIPCEDEVSLSHYGFKFCLNIHTPNAPSPRIAVKSLQAAYQLIKEGIYYAE